MQANIWIVKDSMEAIEQDRQPLGSMYEWPGGAGNDSGNLRVATS